MISVNPFLYEEDFEKWLVIKGLAWVRAVLLMHLRSEHKKKVYDAKKNVRMCRKDQAERRIRKEKLLKDQQAEVRRRANNISKMVQVFWKSVEKITRHNYTITIE